MTASTAARPHTRRPAARRRTRPPHLRVVAPRPPAPPRLPFGLVVVALLAAGFVGLLGLNTASAQNAFRQHQLQARSSLLADREQALEISLERQASPRVLATRARQLGMRPTTTPRYVRLPSPPVSVAPAADRTDVMVQRGTEASARRGRQVIDWPPRARLRRR